MTDKELLDLAAKAIGIKLEWSSEPDLSPRRMPDWDLWNPLTNDGDALRLAVEIGVVVGTYANYSTVDTLTPNERIETITVWHSETDNNKFSATRLAIVRAAAAIGKEAK